MTDEIAQLLKNLHLGRIAEILDEELANADKSSLSYQELLARLLRAQWHQAQENALSWRIARAKLPEKWTLESFPFKKQPGISHKQMRDFAELEFVAKAENLVFIGPTGVGKTGLASSLLLKAIQSGRRCRFIRAQDLFDEMYASLADRSSRMDLRQNSDGSVDIYCGPKAPAGFEKNWIPTVPGKNWFAYFRFYQPTEAYFDRSWPLRDFEQV